MFFFFFLFFLLFFLSFFGIKFHVRSTLELVEHIYLMVSGHRRAVSIDTVVRCITGRHSIQNPRWIQELSILLLFTHRTHVFASGFLCSRVLTSPPASYICVYVCLSLRLAWWWCVSMTRWPNKQKAGERSRQSRNVIALDESLLIIHKSTAVNNLTETWDLRQEQKRNQKEHRQKKILCASFSFRFILVVSVKKIGWFRQEK